MRTSSGAGRRGFAPGSAALWLPAIWLTAVPAILSFTASTESGGVNGPNHIYVRPGAITKALGICHETLRTWCIRGAIRFIQLPSVSYAVGLPPVRSKRPMRRIELQSVLEFLESGGHPIAEGARKKLLRLKPDPYVPRVIRNQEQG